MNIRIILKKSKCTCCTVSAYSYSAAIDHFVQFNMQADPTIIIYFDILWFLNCSPYQMDVDKYVIKHNHHNPEVSEESDDLSIIEILFLIKFII